MYLLSLWFKLKVYIFYVWLQAFFQSVTSFSFSFKKEKQDREDHKKCRYMYIKSILKFRKKNI